VLGRDTFVRRTANVPASADAPDDDLADASECAPADACPIGWPLWSVGAAGRRVASRRWP